MDVVLAWFVENAPKVLAASVSLLVGAIAKNVAPLLLDRVTKKWLKRAQEIDALDDREKERAAAAEAFTAEARAMLEDANRKLAADLAEAQADLIRATALHVAAEKRAQAIEEMARA